MRTTKLNRVTGLFGDYQFVITKAVQFIRGQEAPVAFNSSEAVKLFNNDMNSEGHRSISKRQNLLSRTAGCVPLL